MIKFSTYCPIFRLQVLLVIFLLAMVVWANDDSSLKSFKFLRESIGWEEDFHGVIDEGTQTITFTTQKWVENIDKLAAVFETDGEVDVSVGAKRQVSGTTQNDFRKNIVYTVGNNEYMVKFVSPQASGLPVIRIDTDNAAPIKNKEDWVTMTFSMTDPNNPRNDIPAIRNQQIRGRGNSTWSFAKKPYRVRFRSGQEQSMFGLPAARNWVLLAEFQDPTFLMNTAAFELGRNIFKLPYTCTYHHVQVYLNGIYNGLYGFTEHKQADPKEQGAPGRPKVDLNEGWFVELDRRYNEEPKFRTTKYDLPIMIKSPEFSANSDDERFNFVKKDWNELTDSMAAQTFPENGYRNLIDMETFIDFLMTQEITRNVDFQAPGSTFSYKDKGGKISMGPLWDFDWGYGIGFYSSSNSYAYFTMTGMSSGQRSLKHDFFNRFYEDPVFFVKYKERWNKKHGEILAVSEFLNTLGANIRNAAWEDAKRWNIPGGYRLNYSESDPDHAKQVERMVNWWKARAAFLHAELNKVDVLPASKDFGTAVYAETPPQTFTLVSYGEMTNLLATLQKDEESAFEIVQKLTQKPTGNGGYLATISVRPKEELSIGKYSDILVLSGSNQGKSFSINVPLNFEVTKNTPVLALYGHWPNVVYDGLEHPVAINIIGLGAVTVKYNGSTNAPIDAGTYAVSVSTTGNANYLALKDIPLGEFSIYKANGATVSAPVLATFTHNSITIDAVTASNGQEVEYAIATSSAADPLVFGVFDLLEFSNLTENTEYYIFARTKENANYHTGKASEHLLAQTASLQIQICHAGQEFVDGECNTSQTTRNIVTNSNISISLNGANLSILGLTKAETVRIFDLKGKVIMTKTVSPSESVSIVHLPKGMYLVNVNGKTLRMVK